MLQSTLLSLLSWVGPCSAEGLQDISRVIFQNAECKKQFGLPRSQAEFVEIHKSYSETERQMQRAWILKATQVLHVQTFIICSVAFL
jgi:hypothetical protein